MNPQKKLFATVILAILFNATGSIYGQVYLPDFTTTSPSDFLSIKKGSILVEEYSGKGSNFDAPSTFKNGWVKVEFYFQLIVDESGFKPLFSEVEITIAFDAMKLDDKGNKDKNGYTLFKNSYTYINVAENKNKSEYYLARMYVPPMIVSRFGEVGLFKKPENVYVKVGAKLAGASNPKINEKLTVEAFLNPPVRKGEENWFNGGEKAPDNSLLSPMESPFWAFESINYPQVKLNK